MLLDLFSDTFKGVSPDYKVTHTLDRTVNCNRLFLKCLSISFSILNSLIRQEKIECVLFEQLNIKLVSSVELSMILFVLLKGRDPKDDQL